MSRASTSLVLGYHGCSREVGEAALKGSDGLRLSSRDYDWLGPGVYFWENDPTRAAEWAHDRVGRGTAAEAFMVGAVIDLGNCLDLTQRENLELLANAYDAVVARHHDAGTPVPVNKTSGRRSSGDKLLRYLDCDVIRYLHRKVQETPELKPFDTVRSPFFEGEAIYPGAGFFRQTHTQVAVINLECIVGIFRPRDVEEIIRQTSSRS